MCYAHETNLINMTRNKFTTKEIGNLGEEIACKYLKNKGFAILEQNYWRKWGELDVIAKLDEIVHFVEVKTVSYETKPDLKNAVARGTWRPEEQVHKFKLKKLYKAVETWIADKKYEGEWQIDVVAIRVVPRETYASVKYLANIIE